MGLEIDRERFVPQDYDRFRDRLESCLTVLEKLLERPGFGSGEASLGAELEVSLTDAQARPLPLNEAVLSETLDERMTFELDRFNLECNLRHTTLEGRPFTHLRREIETARTELARAAERHGGRIAMIGILPTLIADDLQSGAMTDAIRYRALSRSLREKRSGPFRLDISGADPLEMACEDVTFEGAATSFQVHLRVAPEDFATVFDAAQLATAPVLAASVNSPTFLGHRLWQETRVALFKQAVDDRDAMAREARRQARVSFGTGWLRGGALDLFREAARDHPVLLPILYDEDPEAALGAGRVPALKEIRLHQGTVWHWNRPVYDPHDGGHVRIELRALPSGPTTEDMLANAAFLVGLAVGLAPHMEAVRTRFDFERAHHNFYRAAQSGLEARLDWPESLGGGTGRTARELLAQLGDLALEGLLRSGVRADEAAPLVECVLARAETGQTGARWQMERLAKLEGSRSRSAALARMFEEYLEQSAGGEPVHRWALS
ncbi:MAG TPA: glutamate--cysteine ligase [Myxococcota bacterium]|nr:glutamate--cysteine ligase [Myxococcota bacterium]